MQLSAIRITQNQKDLFLTTLSVADLIKLSQVDYWSPEKEGTKDQGYQRNPEQGHINKIADYLQERDILLPTVILLNSRKPLGFVESGKDSLSGTINLKPQDILWNVDGQHRVAGMKKSVEENGNMKISDFSIPVVIASGLTKEEEMMLFYTINRTQKGVRTDLTERLISARAKTSEGREEVRRKGQDWIVRAVKIVDYLNTEPSSPWQGRIQLPNTKLKAPAKQASLTKSLLPLLKNGILENYSDTVACQLILIYWKAVQEVFPEAFEDPKKYAIQKTPGFFPLHAVANRIFMYCQAKNRFKQSTMVDLLREAAKKIDIDNDFWRVDNEEGATLYGSMKGFRLLADKFLDHLPTPDIAIEA